MNLRIHFVEIFDGKRLLWEIDFEQFLKKLTLQFKKIIFLSVNVEVGTARPAASAYEPAAHHLIKVCLDEYIYRYMYIEIYIYICIHSLGM